MSLLSEVQIARLRTHPHGMKFYLAVHKPRITLRATVNDLDIAQGARVIPYTFIAGDIAGVHVNMTLFVGTTPGGSDKGRVRIKARDETTVWVAENSHILWEHGDYICVAELYEPWGIYPRVETNDDGDQVLVYQDYDVEYVDQNEHYPPVAIMGPPVIGFMEPLVGFDAYYDASRSYGLNGETITGHDWFFENLATPVTSADATPGWVHFSPDGPHDFHVHDIVTDTAGKTHHAHRWVRIFTDDDPPITKFEVTSMTGSYAEGTWRASIIARDQGGQLQPIQFMDGAHIAIFTDNTIAKLPFNPNYVQRENLLFVGWVVGETIRRDSETDDVAFEAVGTCGRMDLIDSFPDTLEIPTATEHATKWWEADNLNLDLALYTHLKWRSTIFDIVDVYLPQVVFEDWHPGAPWAAESYEYRIMRQDFQADSLYRQCDQLMCAAMGRALSDRCGSVFFRIDPQAYPTANRGDLPTYMHLEDGDWKEELSIEGRELSEVSQIDLAGVDYHGGVDPETDAHPILALAPGTTPLYEGAIEKVDGLILAGGQAFANRLAGDILGWRNNPFPASKMNLAGSYVWADFAPPIWVQWTLDPTTNKRGIGWSQARFIPRTVEIRLLSEGGYTEVLTELEKEASGPEGITGIYPPTEPPTGPTPWPGLPPPPTTPSGGIRWRKHVLLASSVGPYWTNTFVEIRSAILGTPSWRHLIGGMDDGDYDTLCLAFHPTEPHATHYCLTPNAVYRRRAFVSDDWVRVLHTSECSGSVNPAFYTMQTNPLYPNHLYVVFWAGPMYGTGGSRPRAYLYKSVDQGDSWTANLINVKTVYRYSRTSSLQVLSTGSCNQLYVALWDAPFGTILYRSNDFGVTWDQLPPRVMARTGFGLAPDANILFKNHRIDLENRLYRTLDGCQTWEALDPNVAGWYVKVYSNIPKKHWINIQLSELTRVSDGLYMYKSTDYGDTWTRTLMTSGGFHMIDCVEVIPDSPDYLYTWCDEDLGYNATKLGASQTEGAIVVSKQGNIPDEVFIRDMTPIWTL